MYHWHIRWHFLRMLRNGCSVITETETDVKNESQRKRMRKCTHFKDLNEICNSKQGLFLVSKPYACFHLLLFLFTFINIIIILNPIKTKL